MTNMVVVQNKDGTVSCLPISKKRDYYRNRYEVITFVNKLWNPRHVVSIKKHFEKRK